MLPITQPLSMGAVSSVASEYVNAGVNEYGVKQMSASIKQFAKRKMWREAVDVLSDMTGSNIVPNIFAYSIAISACGKSQQVTQALNLLAAMHDADIEGDSIIYNAVISACEKRAQWEQGLAIFQQMKGRRVAPDVISYSASISACGRAGQWERALALVSDMSDASLEMDRITANAVISSCEKGEQWSRAHWMLAKMEAESMDVDVVSYSAAISACEKCARWEVALSLLKRSESRSLQKDATLYNAVIGACSKGNQWQASVAMLREMQEGSLRADAASYNSAILSCSEAQQAASGLVLQDELLSSGIQLDTHIYSLLLLESEQLDVFDRETDLWHRFSDTGPWTDGTGRSMRAAVIIASSYRRLSAKQDLDGVRDILQDAAEQGACNTASEYLWRMCGGRPEISMQWRPLSLLDLQSSTKATFGCIQWSKYEKELRLLQHVLDSANVGDPESVWQAMEAFDEGERWSKLAGAEKMDLFVAGVEEVSATGIVLEIGTYCGYSGIRLAASLSEMRIASIEGDPVFVMVARNIIALSGLAQKIDVWTGNSKHVLPRLACRGLSFRAVFMDRWGSQYHDDLVLLERLQLLNPAGSVVIADAVLRYGASLFIWSVLNHPYKTKLVRVNEFASQLEDSMSFSIFKLSGDDTYCPPPKAPHEFEQLHRESEAMRLKVIGIDFTSAVLAEKNRFLDDMGVRLESLLGRWCSQLHWRRTGASRHSWCQLDLLEVDPASE